MTGAAQVNVEGSTAAQSPGRFTDMDALDLLEAQAADEAVAATADAPNPAGQARAQKVADESREAAAFAVAVGLGLVSEGVKRAKGVTVTFDADVIAEGADAVAPLLAKHGGMPPWVTRYKEEFTACMFAGKVALQVWMAIKAAESGAAAPAAA